jgi:AraC-like DNA-binding protein
LNLVLSCKQQSLDSALRIRLSCLLFSLLSECFMQVRPTEDSAKKQPKAAPGPSQRKKSGRPIVYAVRYMRRHLSNPDLSLLEIAGAVGYNPNYFCQEFSQIFGVSPIRHLNEMRVLRALRYLDETELRIQEICKHVGIRNPGNFTHMVKLKVGMTPMEYRRDQRSRSMQANPPLETGAPGGG